MFCLQNCEVPAQVEPQDNTTMTRNAEFKLIAVTLTLIILRSFTFAIDIFDYLTEEARTEVTHSWAMILLLPAVSVPVNFNWPYSRVTSIYKY